jgi:para-nitrobenzyl esterase
VQNYSWAQAHSRQGKKAFVYRFTRKLPATGTYAHYGAFHTGEVAYAYDNLRFIDHQLRPLNATDDKLATTMSNYWVNFVKTGDPNGKGLPVWPIYDTNAPKIMLLGDQSEAAPLTDKLALEFLLNNTAKR